MPNFTQHTLEYIPITPECSIQTYFLYLIFLDHTDIAANLPDAVNEVNPIEKVKPIPVTIKPPHTPLSGTLTPPTSPASTENLAINNNDFFDRTKSLIQLKMKEAGVHPKKLTKFHKMLKKQIQKKSKKIGKLSRKKKLGGKSQKKKLGKKSLKKNLGKKSLKKNLGKKSLKKNLGKKSLKKNLGKLSQKKNLGKKLQKKRLGKKSQMKKPSKIGGKKEKSKGKKKKLFLRNKKTRKNRNGKKMLHINHIK